MNEIVDDDEFVLSNKNFTSIRLPNEKNFIEDARPDTPDACEGRALHEGLQGGCENHDAGPRARRHA
jgi:hypothetical protein